MQIRGFTKLNNYKGGLFAGHLFYLLLTFMAMNEMIDERALHIRSLINADVQQVWDAFVVPEQLTRWWAPEGFSTTVIRMVAAPGEEWLLSLYGPDGKHYPNKAKYLEVVPGEKIVYEHFNPDFISTILLEAQGMQTMLEWTLLFETKEMRDIIVQTFKADEGHKENVAKLHRFLQWEKKASNNDVQA